MTILLDTNICIAYLNGNDEQIRSRFIDSSPSDFVLCSVVKAELLSTVRMADHIAVLEAGEVIEQGEHAELMELDGKYARLFELQARGYR